MMRLKSYLVFAVAVVWLFSASASFAQSSWRFKASNDVTIEQQKTLRQDVESFSKIPFVIKDETFNKVMGLQGSVKPQDLVAWLSARAKYVVGEAFELSEKDMYIASETYKFQYPGIFPEIAQSPTPENTQTEGGKKVKIVMSNLGTALYLIGKMNNFLLGLQMPGLERLPVTSPRVGILQIGESLFEMGRTKNNKLERDSSLMRVSTLFHEARHSDGNRKSLGFAHAICPPGHDYAGFSACDFSLNGAYSVGYQVGRVAAENCKKCSVAQREALRLDYLDSLSRVLPKQENIEARYLDAIPEGRL